MEKNIPTKLLELPIEEFIELKKELDDNCLITFLAPIDFFKTRVIDKREKIKSLLNKQNIIFELMKVNPSFVLYYNYYFGIKLHDFSIDFILELISIYQENPEVLECLLKILPTNLKIEVLKQYDFPSNILYKIGTSLSIEVTDYLFKENVRFNTLSRLGYYDIKYLLSCNYSIPDAYLKDNLFINRIITQDNVKNYRLLMNLYSKKYYPDLIEEKRREYYDKVILNYNEETCLLKNYEDFYNNVKLIINTSMSSADLKSIINKYINFLDFSDPMIKFIISYYEQKDLDGLLLFLQEESNLKLTNMIIDYHFRDIPYNFFMNLDRLIKFQETGQNIFSSNYLELYKKILNLDKLSYKEKKELHENLKKIDIMSKFYDDYRKAKDTNFSLIKEKMIRPDNIGSYYNKTLSNYLNIDVYLIENTDYFALVKSLNIEKDEILEKTDLISCVDGASYSLDGNTKFKTFYHPKQKYNIIYGDFEIDQVVHQYPVDSYSCYKRKNDDLATTRVFEFATPERLLDWGMDHNEIIISQNNYHSHDELNSRLINPIPMGIYCYDFITKNDIESSKRTGLPLVVVRTSSYEKPSYLNKFSEYDTIGIIFGYIKEYDYITFEREDDMIKRRVLKK